MIPSNIIQSMLALGASEIDQQSIVLRSYKDMKNYAKTHDYPMDVVKHRNKYIEQTKRKLAILERNQKAMKIGLQMTYQQEQFIREVVAHQDYNKTLGNY